MNTHNSNGQLALLVNFEVLPDVVIHDPSRQNTFIIPAAELVKYEYTGNKGEGLDSGTVTFVIPTEDYVEELPPFIDPSVNSPSVLIQYRKDDKAFFLSYDQLLHYAADMQTAMNNTASISFIIPIGLELIKELPALRRV